MPDFLPQAIWAWPSSWDEVLGWTPTRLLFLFLGALILRAILVHVLNRVVRGLVSDRMHPRTLKGLVPRQRREQRITALGSMGRAVITFVIAFVAILMALDELGFNVTTIVAGGSVVGVAFAFGTQSIIKDLLSGIFMLIEDQLGVGDYVDMDKASGTVESVGLRVTQLRDDNGNVWFVRNGEVLRVGNFSQGGSGRPIIPEAAAWTLSYSPANGKPTTSTVEPPEPAHRDDAPGTDEPEGRERPELR